MNKENKKEDQYLPEDKKMLDELENSELFNPGINNDGFNKQLQIMQIKATLRSIKSMKDLDKSTSYFSTLLGVFALIQIIIAIFQFSLSAIDAKNKILGLFLVIVFVLIMIYILKTVSKYLENK